MAKKVPPTNFFKDPPEDYKRLLSWYLDLKNFHILLIQTERSWSIERLSLCLRMLSGSTNRDQNRLKQKNIQTLEVLLERNKGRLNQRSTVKNLISCVEGYLEPIWEIEWERSLGQPKN